MRAEFKRHTLRFITPAGTSRGIYKTKDSWLITLFENGKSGVGECSLLKDLSIDDRPDFEDKINQIIIQINNGSFNFNDPLFDFPAIKFGLETALLELKNGGKGLIFPSSFTRGDTSIVTNGLIWMGTPEYMQQQIAEKLDKGFSCIKLKIGSLNWATERRLIEAMRKQFTASELTIRVDANGAYSPNEALSVLNDLAKLQVHSIEQPIRAKQWEQMARLCENTPLPIALDEELIGVYPLEQKRQLLQSIKPQFIILKPGLLGGFIASDEWIDLAENMNIGWWVTSALESNIGLNAIAQWTATKNNPLPQGLGTGMLFENNFESCLQLEGEKLIYNTPQPPKGGGNYPPLGERNSALVTSVVKNYNNALPQYPPFRGLGGKDLGVDFLLQKTSGSTGEPKTIKLKESAMIASARKTLNFFNLKEGDTALLCLPAHYIAGKMMLVRAQVGGLNLLEIEPKGRPDIPDQTIHFAAMVPMQVQNLIDSGYDFKNIKNLIIGGANVSYKLNQAIKKLPNAVYATYGMTETYSHIALQRLNGSKPDSCFKLLDGYAISTNENGCLVINAPEFSDEPIVTTDLVEILSPKEFRWLGRADNVINSGVIKILPEEMEAKISEQLNTECLIVPVPDDKLGQQAILVLEKATHHKNIDLQVINLPFEKHKIPKAVYYIDAFPRNESMKIDRKKTIEIVMKKM
jgi:o-succinylbenzoate synthase